MVILDLFSGIINLQLRQKVKLSLCLTKHYAMKVYGEWMYRSIFS
jgi:hypothetical protein